MAKVLVLYYSAYGHIEAMANAVAAGAREAGATVDVKRVPELVPAEGEFRVYKRHNSAFEDTPLESELARLGATRIVLAGACTTWCIRSEAYAALERGYDVIFEMSSA